MKVTTLSEQEIQEIFDTFKAPEPPERQARDTLRGMHPYMF